LEGVQFFESHRMKKVITISGWVFVILCVLLGVSSSVQRFITVTTALLAQEPLSIDPYEMRYVEHPFLTYFHVVSGLVFMLLLPLQFVPRIRNKWIGFHHISGRIVVVSGIVAALSGIAYGLITPIRVPLLATAAVLFGLLLLLALGKAMYHILRREIALHREWMIRAFAIALGISTIRMIVMSCLVLTDMDIKEFYGISFWIGWPLNVVVAEIWIRTTRKK
jgi:hypothetical protein